MYLIVFYSLNLFFFKHQVFYFIFKRSNKSTEYSPSTLIF